MSYKEYQPVSVVSPVNSPHDDVHRLEDAEVGGEEEVSLHENKGRGGCCSCWRNLFSVGCAVAVVTCLYFFIVIPTGVLLIIHGHHRGSALTLSLGSGLLFIFTCALPAICLGIRYRRTTREFRLHSVRKKHQKLSDAASDGHPAVTLKATSPLKSPCSSVRQSPPSQSATT